MDLLFDAAQRAFADEVDAFLVEALTPELRRAQRLTAGVFPEPDIAIAWQRLLHARGWGAPAWPIEHGGTGWDAARRYLFESRCARAGAPQQIPLGLALVAPVIMRFGNEEQQRRFLPPIIAGDDYWCQGYSEPGAGSDLATLRTRAVRDGDDYVVSGQKIWTTHAHRANRMFALVRTSDEPKKQQGLSFLLIEMERPGITVRPILTIGGDHEVNEVFLDDVRVPVANRVGEEGAGWGYGKFLLECERGAIVAAPRLRAALEGVRALAMAEPDGDHAVIDDAAVRARLSAIEIDIDALEIAELKTMLDMDEGRSPGTMASSMLKLRASQLRQAISTAGIDVLGPNAAVWEAQRPLHDIADPWHGSDEALVALPRYLDDRAHTIFGGASEIQYDILARALIGF